MAVISIVIPVYNAELFIRRCLDSVLEQSFTDWEAILVNDGSTDSSLEICNKYSIKDNRIKVISRENGGPSAARNEGIDLVKTKYITFVDSDDWIHSDYLKALIKPFTEDSTIDLVCCNYVEFSKNNPKGLKICHLPLDLREKKISNLEFSKYVFEGVNGVLWSKAFKIELIKKNKLRLNEQVRLSEDVLLVLEYLHFAKIVFSSDSHLYFYNRLYESNLSGKFQFENLRDLEITNKEISKLSVNLDIDSKNIVNRRTKDTVKKIVFDTILSEKPLLQKNNDLDKLSLLTNNFKSIKPKNFKEIFYFILLRTREYIISPLLIRGLKEVEKRINNLRNK